MEKIKKLLKNKTFLMIAGAILFVVILNWFNGKN